MPFCLQSNPNVLEFKKQIMWVEEIKNIQSAEEYASLMKDIEWLENEYASIKEAGLAAEIKRKRIEDRLKRHELLELFQ